MRSPDDTVLQAVTKRSQLRGGFGEYRLSPRTVLSQYRDAFVSALRRFQVQRQALRNKKKRLNATRVVISEGRTYYSRQDARARSEVSKADESDVGRFGEKTPKNGFSECCP